jgi:hypothetical protein
MHVVLVLHFKWLSPRSRAFTYDPDLRAHFKRGLARGSIIFACDHTERARVVWDLVCMVSNDPPLVTVLFANINGALFLFCTWSYGTHVPTILTVRGWVHPNHLTVCIVFRLCVGSGFKHAFWSVFWVQAHRGAFWRTRASKLEGREW